MSVCRSSGSFVTCAIALFACAALCPPASAVPDLTAVPVTSLPFAPVAEPIATPARLATPTLDRVPALLTGVDRPTLVYAQRTIDRGIGDMPVPPEEPYREMEIEGWKSPGLATGMSALLPGSGQLYSGSSRGYIFLGVEAVAIASIAAFSSKKSDTQDEYYSYVGDPYQSTSRFSFDRLAGAVGPAEVERLRVIYERDQREFYDAVTHNDTYAAGWVDANDRFDADNLADESDRYARKAKTGIYVLIANHLVSAVDALNLARFNNIALKDNLSLKLKLRPGLRHSSYAFTVTQKF